MGQQRAHQMSFHHSSSVYRPRWHLYASMHTNCSTSPNHFNLIQASLRPHVLEIMESPDTCEDLSFFNRSWWYPPASQSSGESGHPILPRQYPATMKNPFNNLHCHHDNSFQHCMNSNFASNLYNLVTPSPWITTPHVHICTTYARLTVSNRFDEVHSEATGKMAPQSVKMQDH